MGTVSLVRRKRKKSNAEQKQQSDREETLYAMKSIMTNRVSRAMLVEMHNEINVLRALDHPNIIQLREVYKTKNATHLIMGYCAGGSLSGKIFPELRAAEVLRQILRALTYMHERNICHRDLKLENIMLASEDENAPIKLIDFGLSRMYVRGEKMMRVCGTVYTMAPEMITETGYTHQADMWSVGIIAWALISGNVPFLRTSEDLADAKKKQKFLQAKYQFQSQVWNTVTREVREFIGSLLRRRPESRWTARQALQFVEERWLPAVRELSQTPGHKPVVDEAIINSIQRFANYSHFKQTMLMVLAFSMDKRKLVQLSEVFLSLDREQQGVISFDDLKQGLSQFGMSDEQLRGIFQAVDQDNSGGVRYMEFLAATLEAKGFLEEEKLEEAFERMDAEHTGYITLKGLRTILGNSFDPSTVEQMLREVNPSQSGMISYEEFLDIMQPKVEQTYDPDLILMPADDKESAASHPEAVEDLP